MGTEAETQPKASIWNVPNILSLIRLLLVPLFGWMLISHPEDPNWRYGATAVFIVAMLTDLLDGWWARKYNLVTDFGKLFDSIADKAMTGMAFIGLSVIGELPWWITILILVREWGITILRFAILKYGVMAADRTGKLKTALQTLAIIMFLLPFPQYHWGDAVTLAVLPDLISWILMYAALILTVVSGINYCFQAWKLRQEYYAKQPNNH